MMQVPSSLSMSGSECHLPSRAVRSACPLAQAAQPACPGWIVVANSCVTLILLDVKAGSPDMIMHASLFWCPCWQPRFTACFTPKSKEGGFTLPQTWRSSHPAAGLLECLLPPNVKMMSEAQTRSEASTPQGAQPQQEPLVTAWQEVCLTLLFDVSTWQ